ncbi:MAG: hypothetical protein WD794_16460 [Mycobacteriales bacterium]
MPSCSRVLSRRSPAVATRRSPAVVARVLTSALLGVLVVLLPVSPAAAAPATVSPDSAIEGFSPYQGQTACEPVVRPGVVAFRDLVLAAYPGTGDSGMTRACTSGGTSEHKEGRAWDWRANTADPTQVAQVADLMDWLLAPDEHGNSAAMARRLGVMYVIWDSRIWKSYQADRGWQSYTGANPHTDHVHLSFSWAGALKETSYWTGRVSPVLTRPVPPPETTTSDSATVTIDTPALVADRRVQVERRRTLVRNLPGPWRRH